MTADQTFVRDALYSAMYAIYPKNKENNTITVEENESDGSKYIKFIIKSGELKSSPKSLLKNKYYKDAITFAEVAHGKVELIKNPKRYEIQLTFKQSSKI